MQSISYDQMRKIQEKLVEVLRDMNFQSDWIKILQKQFEENVVMATDLDSLGNYVSWSMRNYGIHVDDESFADTCSYRAIVIALNEILAEEVES